MFQNLFNKIRALLNLSGNISSIQNGYNSMQFVLNKHAVESKILQGQILHSLHMSKVDEVVLDIAKAEFKVFSQWGDDGIIDFLVDYLDIDNKTFVEFGVENYTECNTKYLLMNKNWKGLIMDGSKANMDFVRHSDLYWQYDLTALDIFITAENINSLLTDNGFSGEIGLLHIDIDGNDYWVWKNISVANAVIVIVEYNSVFGNQNPWTIPYDAEFYRTNAHHSNLYYGTSLTSICDLATEKGYSFVGCNSNGNNAYFVRNDKLKGLKVKSPKTDFVLSKFSEHRDEKGVTTFLRGEQRIESIRGLPVYNTVTNEIELI